MKNKGEYLQYVKETSKKKNGRSSYTSRWKLLSLHQMGTKRFSYHIFWKSLSYLIFYRLYLFSFPTPLYFNTKKKIVVDPNKVNYVVFAFGHYELR